MIDVLSVFILSFRSRNSYATPVRTLPQNRQKTSHWSKFVRVGRPGKYLVASGKGKISWGGSRDGNVGIENNINEEDWPLKTVRVGYLTSLSKGSVAGYLWWCLNVDYKKLKIRLCGAKNKETADPELSRIGYQYLKTAQLKFTYAIFLMFH